MAKTKVAIIGSGNIGTDLMRKIQRIGRNIEMGAMVGIDPNSEGLRMAREAGFATTAEGVEGLVKLPVFKDIEIVFDATSAGAHKHHDAVLRQHGKRILDLTPAAIGPFCIPVVNAADLATRLGPPKPSAGDTWSYFSDDPPRGWTTAQWPTPLPEPDQLKNYRFFIESITQLPGW